MTDCVTLVLGGARSGKTARALELAKPFSKRVYIATAQPLDDEMNTRIAAHRKQRGPSWETIEAPLELADAVMQMQEPDSVAVVDCLTLWLSNMTFAKRDVANETTRLVSAMQSCPGAIIMVSNEVGLGIVPDNAISRAFRDAHGRLNQDMASVADVVEFIAAGLPLRLKP